MSARYSLLGVLLGLVGIVAACQPAAPSAPTAKPVEKPAAAKPTTLEKVAYGHLPGAAVPAYVGKEKGYFAEQGIDMELVAFPGGGPAMVPPIATNELQISQQSMSPGVFNAMARGIKLIIVADSTRVDPNGDENLIVVRSQDADKIREVKDLKGKKVAVQSIPGIQVIQLEKILVPAGLKLTDVSLEAIGLPDVQPALASGAVDAAHLHGSWAFAAVARGVATKLAVTNPVYPNHQTSVIVFSDVFATQRSEAARRWMVGYLKSLREVQAARGNEAARKEVAAIVTKYASVPPESVFIYPASLEGRVNLESMLEDLAWYRDRGYLEGQPPELSKFVDHQFVEFADKQLK